MEVLTFVTQCGGGRNMTAFSNYNQVSLIQCYEHLPKYQSRLQ